MKPIETVAVIGAGTMGHSLALAFAQGGCQVWLNDLQDEILARARGLIAASVRTLIEAGALAPAEEAEVLGRIRTTSRIEEAGADADFVIEAVTENQAIKQAAFSALDRVCPPRAILASNTSYMDIFRFVETGRPGKVLITHWFAPPHIVPLVEVVRGPETAPETVEAVTEVLTRIGKKPIVITRFLPGFIANRLQSALTNEMLFLVDNGYATPEDIDTATKASFGFRMPILGVAKKIDLAGVDQIRRSIKNGLYEPPPPQRDSKIMDRLVAEGRLGVKSGQGFFDYGGRSTAEIMGEINVKLIRLREFLKGIGEM